jgi:hypothetical protein
MKNIRENPYLKEMRNVAPELWREGDSTTERKKWLENYESLYSQSRQIAAMLDPQKDKKAYDEFYNTVLPEIREAIQYLKDFDYKEDVKAIGKEQKDKKIIEVKPPTRIPSPKAVTPHIPFEPQKTVPVVNPFDEKEEKKDHFYDFGTRLNVDERATNWKIGSIFFVVLLFVALGLVAASLLKVVIF